ncbi:MAG: CBS domain-containing protein [Candidatus Hydrogenedentes bacterium]|nr:CBS domain-containing protein [Candidatus Hydrogenedentota bacterium]
MMKVSDIIKPRDIYWVNENDTVRQAVRYMCERKTGAVAVKGSDNVVGVFSERDLMHRVVDGGLDPNSTLMRDVMSTNLIYIHLDDEIHMAKAIMFKNGVRHLLVVGKGDQCKGLISMRDLIEADMQDSQELIHRLNDVYYEQAYCAKWRISSNRVIVEPYLR